MEQTMERFLLVETIVTEMLNAPQQQRAELIEARCGVDRTLAAEVRLLLDACDAEEQMMASCRLEPRVVREDGPGRKPVGSYEIDRLLGRGGMGAVYLAHRADGHFEQEVAIKLIDRPFATDLFRERFRQERQILAGLQHPYIARLLDGGVTAEGELYLVMEYVDGVPIHRYCDERHLSQSQRIKLFLLACEAVQFAHQNFVVHRDLKPDNILVAGDSTPRLLDFGTAKLLSPSLEKQDSQLTREGYLSYTPQYASPEQVSGDPITTASDTYSLGVLLYFLLTGTLPYQLKDLTMGQMMKAVCEEAPRKPVAAIGTGKQLDADLEAILLKALRKEPQERYLTAERMADDLRAYLGGLPVAARRGTSRYRAAKFIRRNRWALAAAIVLLVTLLAGIGGVAWQARVANGERRTAVARSADLRQLSNSLLTELDDAIQQIPGSTGAQKLLVTRVLERLDRMAQTHSDRTTQLDLASAYTRLADLQGNAYHQNLGDASGALISVNKAIALCAPWASRDSNDQEALQALATAQMSRGQILFGTAPIQQAIASTEAAIKAYERLIDISGDAPGKMCETAVAYSVLGDELGFIITESLNDTVGANRAYRRSLDLYTQALRIDPNLVQAKRGLASGLLEIVPTEKESDPEQGLKDVQLGLQRIAALPKEEQQSLRMTRIRESFFVDEAFVLTQLGRYSEADEIMAGPVQSSMRRATADPQDLRSLADVLFALDRQAGNLDIEADPALGASIGGRRRYLAAEEKSLVQERDGLERMVKLNPSQQEWKPVLGDAEVRLGSVQSILRDQTNAAELVRKGLATLRESIKEDPGSPEIFDTTAKDLLIAEPASLKNPQLAVSYSERAVALTHRKMPSRLLTLSQAYAAAGQTEKCRMTATDGLALLPDWQAGTSKSRLRKLLEIEARSGL
ncbi:MAG: protein kinase [Terracidiphilus sp.]|jgi:tetratricopeptide (TPR) repeat protein/predicted Ser/Thr protein kinase